VPRQACKFRQRDLTRALRATLAAGLGVANIEIDTNGKIKLVLESGDLQQSVEGPDEWEDRLNGKTQNKVR
jgi:hypothetical protein